MTKVLGRFLVFVFAFWSSVILDMARKMTCFGQFTTLYVKIKSGLNKTSFSQS